jgi:hypothetical protein
MVLAIMAFADEIPIGFISYDVNIPGSVATFDITNQTGPNASVLPDMTFPVTTPVHLSDLALTVDFSDGSASHFGPSYFTLGLDGLSFDGGTIPIGGANPQPNKAILSGTFSATTITLNDGSTETIDMSFSATILPSSPPNLADGDLALINASTTTTVVPEPNFGKLLGAGVLVWFFYQGFKSKGIFQKLRAGWQLRAAVFGLIVVCVVAAAPASAATFTVKLNTATAPSTGVAGVAFVNVTGTGFPTGHGSLPPGKATLKFALSCGGPSAASANPQSIITIIGSADRMHVLLPETLSTNNYFVSVSGTTSDGTTYASSKCSEVEVTHTNPTLAACVPTSSLGIVAPVKGPAAVKALVPNAAWMRTITGIQVVQLETGGGPVVTPISVTTPNAVNSCAGNPATGEGVCVANNTDVYHLSPTNAVTTLTSGANALTGFSGGSCENCGVAVNALTNQAVIAMGRSATPNLSGSALQTLNLATNSFGTPRQLVNQVSEDISIDPTRGFILSPNERSNYAIAEINSTTGAFKGEFGNQVPAGEFDSAAEDCTTGIALSAIEFTSEVFLADLTQATFTSGSPAGTWTAPHAIIVLNTTGTPGFSAGTSGITVAPGTSHLATVTGEFGGSTFAVLKLPSTSGSGTPALVDYAVTCITGFSAGLDPHTVSAYTSPNNGKALTVFANSPPPSELIVADMAGILALPRDAGTNTVTGDAGAGSCLDPAGTVGKTVLRVVLTN